MKIAQFPAPYAARIVKPVQEHELTETGMHRVKS
jgi:hypothetical protein